MEGAGDLEDDPGPGGRRLGECREGGELARDDDLAAAVVVGGREAQLVEPREQLGLVASEDGAHAGLDQGGGVGHGASALGDEGHRVGVAQHVGDGRGGELADGVAGDAGDLRTVDAGEERVGGEDAGRHDERLRDGGVADGVGVGRGSVGDEVDPCSVGERREAVGELGVGQPRFEESGFLGALTGRYDNDH
nr:hypothetical protein GCM10025699_51550 [Microbacterium flavescens]